MNIQHCNRRDFLKATGITFSGFLISFRAGAQTANVHVGKLSPNAYIGISKSAGVEMWIGRPEIGQNIRTTFAMILSDELGADISKVTLHQAGPRKDIGAQITGGSSSVRRDFKSLRTSAATVREMLKEAAAKHWGISKDLCETDMGAVLSGNHRMSFEDAAELALDAPIPSNPQLKPSSEFKYIGKALHSLDARDIATGKIQFGMDALPENCAFAIVLRPPVHRGTLRNFDAEGARQMPGVKDIVRFGDKIAVIADNTWNALNASRAVKIDWDHGQFVRLQNSEQEQQKRTVVRAEQKVIHSKGNFETTFAQAADTFECEVSVPTIAHACMEPPTSTAWVHDGRIDIWGSTQNLNRLNDDLETLTGFPRDRITYNQMRIGGGFGRKLAYDYIEEAVAVAKEVDYPVKVTFTRENDLQNSIYRLPDHFRFRVGLEKTGYPSALEETSIKRPRRQNRPSPITQHFDHATFRNRPIAPGLPGAFLRAPGHNIVNFAEQCLFGKMAEAAGIDAMDYWLAAYGHGPTLERLGWPKGLIDDPKTCQLLELVKMQSAWKRDERYGYGIGTFTGYGSTCTLVALAPKSPDTQTVEKIFAAVDCGRVINPSGARAQIEGGIIDALSATLYQKITLKDGQVQQSNFHDYKMLRINEHPEVIMHFVESDAAPQGLGEVSYPPVAGAVVNALHDATGRWFTELPLRG